MSNGFTFTDKNPFGTKYQYDDPKFVDTIAWFNGLQGKGFIARYDQRSSLGTDAVSIGAALLARDTAQPSAA